MGRGRAPRSRPRARTPARPAQPAHRAPGPRRARGRPTRSGSRRRGGLSPATWSVPPRPLRAGVAAGCVTQRPEGRRPGRRARGRGGRRREGTRAPLPLGARPRGGGGGARGARTWVPAPRRQCPRAELGAAGAPAHPRRSGARSVLARGLGCPCAWPPARFPWGDIRPAPRPLPRGRFLDAGQRVGAGKPGREEAPGPGDGGGPATPSAARAPASGGRGGRTRAGPRSEGIFLSRLESDAGGSVLPRPSRETGTYFISLGQVRPRYHPPPGSPSSLGAPPSTSRPPLGRTQAALPPPLRGKAAARQTPGGPAGVGVGAPRSRKSVVQHVRLM